MTKTAATIPLTENDSNYYAGQAGPVPAVANQLYTFPEFNTKLISKIKELYGNDVPPSIQKLESDAMKAANKEGLKSVKANITDYWNDTLRHHKNAGIRLPHSVATTFNMLNTLLRKI